MTAQFPMRSKSADNQVTTRTIALHFPNDVFYTEDILSLSIVLGQAYSLSDVPDFNGDI